MTDVAYNVERRNGRVISGEVALTALGEGVVEIGIGVAVPRLGSLDMVMLLTDSSLVEPVVGVEALGRIARCGIDVVQRQVSGVVWSVIITLRFDGWQDVCGLQSSALYKVQLLNYPTNILCYPLVDTIPTIDGDILQINSQYVVGNAFTVT